MGDIPVMNRRPTIDVLIAKAGTDNGKAQTRVGLLDVSAPRTHTGAKVGGKLLIGGVEGHFARRFTGIGVEATVIEASAEYKDVGAVQLGISADSGIGVGSRKAQAKILGTGIKADTNGVEFTVLGTGLKLGSWASPYRWLSDD